MKDNFYQRLFHESEDYWIPKGLCLSLNLKPVELNVKWENVKQWCDLEYGDDHFHQFFEHTRGKMWSATNDFWASRSSTVIEALLLAVDKTHGRYIGWMAMIPSCSLEGAIDLYRSAAESPAKENLRKVLISFPGWEDCHNMVPGNKAYEQYGFTMMMGFQVIREIIDFIKNRHREIPRYIGGALRLGGTQRAEREIVALFEAMEARPHSRSSVIEALWSSRLDKKLYLPYLTSQEKGLTLDDALGL